uniref:Uncharacterized protein n=1 Tax=CrAss-like virus sp. ctXt06 TaxID=2825837 RepID=A0A8S5V6N7_9CAUD|nr:MAG TPA: hypothetical protein [CrAss-like virus sp. ctXt06]
MPSNRSNSERGKAFDIDTKIEYMNKLYEVRESNQCCDCSLATICSSSDISAGDRNDDALSRDKRINIFGECSSLRRLDKKSVVFVEIPKDDSKDNSKYEYYKISPLWVYNNPTQLRPIEVVLPNGHEIDVESSDLSKGIIRFRRKWLTIEEMYKLKPIVACEYVIPSIAINASSRKKIVALANLMDIARYFNGDWNYNANSDECGYMIAYDKTTTEICGYQVININADTDMYFGNVMFKNEADAQYVIDNPNFRDILDSIFKV